MGSVNHNIITMNQSAILSGKTSEAASSVPSTLRTREERATKAVRDFASSCHSSPLIASQPHTSLASAATFRKNAASPPAMNHDDEDAYFQKLFKNVIDQYAQTPENPIQVEAIADARQSVIFTSRGTAAKKRKISSVQETRKSHPSIQSQHQQQHQQHQQHQHHRQSSSAISNHQQVDHPDLDSSEFERWDLNFKLLVAYKKQHGDCNVPLDYANRQLALWVQFLRLEYQRIKEQQKDDDDEKSETSSPNLKARQVQRLDMIGFDWYFDPTWEARFKDLCHFRAVLGHREALPSDLEKWVKQQTDLMERGSKEKSLLTPIERDRLVRRIQRLQLSRVTCYWETQFEALLEFKKGHGHCKVPVRNHTNPELGKWVGYQRKNYWKRKSLEEQEGSESRCEEIFSANRIQRLCDIGFVWDASRKKKEPRRKSISGNRKRCSD